MFPAIAILAYCLLSLTAPPAAAEAMAKALAAVVTVLPDNPGGNKGAEEPEGSGVVWHGGRHVVTAYHVIAKARGVRIRTIDGDIVAARIAASDPATDLAILSLEAPLPPMAVNLAAPALGAKACVLGNGFGLGITLSCGVVSAVNRAGIGFNAIEDFVQTDAAANPGTSGGALVDGDGRLVGVVTAIFTKRSDANIGVNFAASSALVERVAGDLIKHGRVRRVVTGLHLVPALEGGATGRMAAKVAAVTPGSPADKAGLAVGDEIMMAGTRRIKTPADFFSVRGLMTPPGALALVLRRGSKTMNLRLDIPAPEGR